MKNIQQLLRGIDIVEQRGNFDLEIASLSNDSRNISEHTLFVATKGTSINGHDFIDDVILKGANVIVCEELPQTINESLVYIKVLDSHEALSIIASNFYDRPSSKLKLVGVTGTNGKTTTATLLYQLFTKLGYQVGLLSTVQNIIGTEVLPSTHTTPDPISLNSLLARMVDEGCTHVFMEVSSHSIDQKRIAGLEFTGGIFTNLTHDHLDYHKTIEAYALAKQQFFNMLHPHAFAFSNLDDPYGTFMLENTKASKKYYSLQKDETDITATIIKNDFEGLVIDFGHGNVSTKLVGIFNAYNLLAIYGTALFLDEERGKIENTIPGLTPVDGRFQYVKGRDGIVGIVDYAHTPDAVEKILKTIRDLKMPDAKLITVFGCGGDRDPLKRPIMGHMAGEYSDIVIVTSDNPRSEDPQKIIAEVVSGIDTFELETKKYFSIVDRQKAIEKAIEIATPHDVIAVLGKGHEKYQEIKGVKEPFDDLKKLEENLKNK